MILLKETPQNNSFTHCCLGNAKNKHFASYHNIGRPPAEIHTNNWQIGDEMVVGCRLWDHFGCILAPFWNTFSILGRHFGLSLLIREPSCVIWVLRGGFRVDFGRLWAPFWNRFGFKIHQKSVGKNNALQRNCCQNSLHKKNLWNKFSSKKFL